MLLKTFKSNRTANFILFPLVGVLLWVKNFISPTGYSFFPGEPENLLYSPIHKLLSGYPFIQNLLALALLILLAFFMLQINNRYNFIRIRTMLPVPLFIILVSGFSDVHALHPVYFGAFFLLIAIYRLFDAFDQVQPYSSAFDTGFFLGVAMLFYFNVVVLIPAFLFGIGVLSRETRWREFAVTFTGILLPFVFAFSYAFFTDRFVELIRIFELHIVTPNNYFKSNLPLQVFTGFLALITFLSSVHILKQYDTKKVSTRRFYSVFFLLFICALAGFIFVPGISQEMLVILSIPLTFLMANFFVFLKSRFWSELIFSLLFIMVIFMQFLKS